MLLGYRPTDRCAAASRGTTCRAPTCGNASPERQLRNSRISFANLCKIRAGTGGAKRCNEESPLEGGTPCVFDGYYYLAARCWREPWAERCLDPRRLALWR